MAYVTVPKDLTHVKSKVLFGLTKRQLVCFGGALLTGGPLYFLARHYLSNSAAALLMIFAMLPGLLFALFERHGQPLEVVIQQMIQCLSLIHICCMGYTVLLCFCLFKTGSISKSVFGAH